MFLVTAIPGETLGEPDVKYQTSLPVMEYPEQTVGIRRTSFPDFPDSASSLFSSSSISVSTTSQTYINLPKHHANTQTAHTLLHVRSLTKDKHHHHFHHESKDKPPPPYLGNNKNTSQSFLGEVGEIDCTLHNPGDNSVSQFRSEDNTS